MCIITFLGVLVFPNMPFGAPAKSPLICQLRVTVSPLTKPPRQTILLWFSPIHIVLTPELMTRLASWGADGWGEARIYGHYLLRWVYRYEHIVKIEVRGFEGALLNTEMGCAPLLHLLCSTLTFESRYTSDQMKAERLTVRASGTRLTHRRNPTPHTPIPSRYSSLPT